MKYSIMINGVTKLFMTKADVMSGFNPVKVCIAYKINGQETTEIPFEHDAVLIRSILNCPVGMIIFLRSGIMPNSCSNETIYRVY